MILGALIIANAQIEKIELKLTPEIEEMMVTKIKNLPEEYYSEYGIKNRSQLENLHTGKPIPMYRIVNEKLEDVNTWSVSRMPDGETLSLKFQNTWNVPVMSDEAPLLFVIIMFSDFGRDPYISLQKTANIIAHFHNYEHKDSVIGSVVVLPTSVGMDYLIIRKENQDIFVQVYDDTTGEYFKNEYRLSELVPHLKELGLRKQKEQMEAQMKYFEKIANKSELTLTPELTEMLINQTYSSFINYSDESLSDWGIKDRAQLKHLHFGKPVPMYELVSENLTFTGYWQVPVMSDSEPLFFTRVNLDDEQYRYAGIGGAIMAEVIHNYKYNDLIIGLLDVKRIPYLIIRKDNKDIFVKMYDSTGEYFKTEYTLSEIINNPIKE